MKKPIFWNRNYLLERQNGHQKFVMYQDNDWVEFQLADIPENEFEKAPIITFSKNAESLSSPFSASFGGIHLGAASKDNPVQLVSRLSSYFSINETKHATITLHPSHLNSKQFVSEQTYLQDSWKVLYANINHYVDMENWSEGCMSKGNRKKLRQSRESGLIFAEASRSEWMVAYDVVRKNRESLGSNVSMSEHELFVLLSNYPDTYKCFVLKNDLNNIAAAAFLVETTYENMYVYLWADDPKYRNISPIVFLMTELVSSFGEKYKFLDLGTSAINGEVLEGLSRFKDNLGASRSHKTQVVWHS